MLNKIKKGIVLLVLFSGILFAGFSDDNEKISLSLLKQIDQNPDELITAWIFFADPPEMRPGKTNTLISCS